MTMTLPLLPKTGAHVRGTFPGAELVVVPDAPVGGDGVHALELGNNVVDRDLAGRDAVDGTDVALGGNYGLVYRFALAASSTLALALAPRGGAWGGAGDLFPGADSTTAIVQLPSASEALSSTTQAIAAGRFAASMPVMLALITAGGSNLPVDLLTVPLP